MESEVIVIISLNDFNPKTNSVSWELILSSLVGFQSGIGNAIFGADMNGYEELVSILNSLVYRESRICPAMLGGSQTITPLLQL